MTTPRDETAELVAQLSGAYNTLLARRLAKRAAAAITAQAQEIERLREIAKGVDDGGHWYSQQTMDAVVRERDELREKVERLEKDAERYQTLRDLPEICLGVAGIPCIAIPDGPTSGHFVSYADCDRVVDEYRNRAIEGAKP